jgi:hypothetical protein
MMSHPEFTASQWLTKVFDDTHRGVKERVTLVGITTIREP